MGEAFENHYREKFRVHLADTSSYGNAFYLSFHRWIANIKENYLIEKVPGFSQFFNEQGIKLVVTQSTLKVFREVKLHEEITIIMFCPALKKIKAELKYMIYNSKNEKVAESENVICFLDRNNELILIPEQIHKALGEILNQNK